MKNRDIYLRAAEGIATGRETFSCNAISCHYGSKAWWARELYREIMGIDEHLGIRQVYAACGYSGSSDWETPPEVRDFRVLLLCMMAACCDDME